MFKEGGGGVRWRSASQAGGRGERGEGGGMGLRNNGDGAEMFRCERERLHPNICACKKLNPVPVCSSAFLIRVGVRNLSLCVQKLNKLSPSLNVQKLNKISPSPNVQSVHVWGGGGGEERLKRGRGLGDFG